MPQLHQVDPGEEEISQSQRNLVEHEMSDVFFTWMDNYVTCMSIIL